MNKNYILSLILIASTAGQINSMGSFNSNSIQDKIKQKAAEQAEVLKQKAREQAEKQFKNLLPKAKDKASGYFNKLFNK